MLNERTLKCDKCPSLFKNERSFQRHVDECTGPKLSRLEALEAQVEELTRLIADSGVAVGGADETAAAARGFELKSLNITAIADVLEPQIYLGLTGDLLRPVVGCDGILVKFGESRNISDRCTRHGKDFGSFRILDSVVTKFPEVVEDRLKKILKMSNRMIVCKTPKKTTHDTEVVAIRSQQEYADLVKLIVDIAAKYDEEMLTRDERRLKLENDSRQLKIDELRAEIELGKARLS